LPCEQRIKISVERAHETVTVPLAFEPKLVRFDPGAFILGRINYCIGVDHAVAALQGDPDIVARIRAARVLAKEGSQRARDALQRAFRDEPFWGVLADTAHALGRSHVPSAAAILRDALKHSHPKVRRAAASALGNFRDVETASALIPLNENDPSYFVRAAALTSLGRTRDARAFDILAANAKKETWNGTVEAGAISGLAELADPRATGLVVAATTVGRDEGLRRAAVFALGRIGQLLESDRTRVVEVLDQLLDDPMFMVQLSAIATVESLADSRHLATLDRLTHSAFDGRVQRDAQEAAIRIRERQKVPAQVTGLRDDLDAIREEQRKLQEKIEALAPRP
jgi:aminopeptidase N